ncbi:hypothetical protein AIOL_004709 [Candidatus Rhodobacter oscarellae]|uniref:Uncharacterized protein n=1 Tax=Candidatus Rhodobacter oscarellae TaxID=1675527 RepID=A0A0J9EAT1_9RHOB|nr:hypothetical protein AIOL_004709 [Candidatus Rhodobacter lobularis]
MGVEGSLVAEQELLITLQINASDQKRRDWTVRKVAHKTGAFENCITFRTPETLESAFPAAFAALVGRHLRESQARPNMLSLPDAFVELQDLVLGGMRIVFYKCRDGVQQAVVRFKRMVGTLRGLFRDLRYIDAADQVCDQTSLRALLGLIHPCLQLTSIDGETADSAPQSVGNALETLRRNRDELSFYEQLIKRYVTQRARRSAGIGPSGLEARIPI